MMIIDFIDDDHCGSARIKLPPLPAGENLLKLQLLHTRPTDRKAFVLLTVKLTEE